MLDVINTSIYTSPNFGVGMELLLLVLDIFDGLKTKCSMIVRV
jgi:hypothetical protein